MFDNQFTDEAVRQHHKELIKEAEFYSQHKHNGIGETRTARRFLALIILTVIATAFLL